jgi:hypothetical protein
MVQNLKLNDEQQKWYNKAVVSSGHQYITGELWDRQRVKRADLKWTTDDGLNGQVIVDTSSDAGRTAALVVGDPEGHLHLDSKSLFLDRMLVLKHHVYVPEMADYVPSYMIAGPVSKADNDGLNGVSIEAQGMELWARGAIKVARSWPKGSYVTDVVRALMLDAGEDPKYLDIPDRKERLASLFQVTPTALQDGNVHDFPSRWEAAVWLAASIGCVLFYDGASVCKMRPRFGQIVWVWDGEESVISPVQLSTQVGGVGGSANDIGAIVNDVIGKGQGKPSKPGGKPPALRSEAIAPDQSRFAPHSMGHFNGGGLFLEEIIDMPQVRLQRTLDRLTQMRLRLRLQATEQRSFDSVLVSHLDEYDRARVHVQIGIGMSAPIEFTQATMPCAWSPDNPMTVGYVDLVSEPPQVHHQ